MNQFDEMFDKWEFESDIPTSFLDDWYWRQNLK